MLASLPDVTAVIVHNEVALPAVLETLRSRGLDVPRDISVVAVCPEDVALGQTEALTAVDLPAHTIGCRRGRHGDRPAHRRPARRDPPARARPDHPEQHRSPSR